MKTWQELKNELFEDDPALKNELEIEYKIIALEVENAQLKQQLEELETYTTKKYNLNAYQISLLIEGYKVRVKDLEESLELINKANKEKIEFENLFETREEAIHYSKYMNIPSNETLSLPSYEEFLNNDQYFAFNTINQYISLCVNEEDMLKLITYENDYPQKLLFEQNTKENYYKALDMCVKIWKGE